MFLYLLFAMRIEGELLLADNCCKGLTCNFESFPKGRLDCCRGSAAVVVDTAVHETAAGDVAAAAAARSRRIGSICAEKNSL